MDPVTCDNPTCGVQLPSLSPGGLCDRCHFNDGTDLPRPKSFESEGAKEIQAIAHDLAQKYLTHTTLPVDSALRKGIPLHRGLFRYFPAALAEVAKVSKIGNDKHNPGEEMHHARGKSTDEADCILRHLIDVEEDFGQGVGRDEQGVPQVAYICWRALSFAQKWLEENDHAPLAPGARE